MAQDYAGDLEIVVADAMSDDGTRSVVADYADRNVRLVDNQARKTPAGLNAAIAATIGDVVVRCDAHSELPPTYVTRAIEVLESTGAANVGGIQKAVGIAPCQRAIAAAMSNPFGVGDARFHMGGRPGPVDTVYLGVFRKADLNAVGGFDESLIRNQDYELNHRLRKNGGVVHFDPALEVVYRPRPSLRALWKQYFDYGRWKRVVVRRHPESLKWRQLVAPLFVVALLASVLALVLGLTTVGIVIPVAYATVSLTATAVEFVRRRDVAMALLPSAFLTMHLAWGVGFLLPVQLGSNDR